MKHNSKIITLITILIISIESSECKNWLDSLGVVNFEAGIGISKQFNYSNKLFERNISLTNVLLDANLIIKSKKNNNPFSININSANSRYINDTLSFSFKHISYGVRVYYNLESVLKINNFEIGSGISIINTVATISKKSQINLINNGNNPLNYFATNKLTSTATFIIPFEINYNFKINSPKYFKLAFFYNIALKENELHNLTKIRCSTFGLLLKVPIATIF